MSGPGFAGAAGLTGAVGWRRWWPLVALGGILVGTFCYALVLFTAVEAIPHWNSRPAASSLASLPFFAAMFGLCFGVVLWFPLWVSAVVGGGLVLVATPRPATVRGARLRRLAFSAATALCSAGTVGLLFFALFRAGSCRPGAGDPCMYDFSSVFYDPVVVTPVVFVCAALASWWYAPVAAPPRADRPQRGSW
ncbi:hypothetical protein [Segniliparus rugosus]|uniref:Uncharacterized protein n=1 Tax=Segniliparus rugosus (strain ATCC BAA-974 / DSM 45345 / CCUG 50838 / CIP 108380 / JCM 13579 / CDC 945) TaxID=679197 RepID=E5XPQ9_SEGRC|nr:hypothetical protein [Segniliparus rugosus]EFV13657.1 hypothetical protein HMPREF9336_01481 [Segniliparus rugosus ATCC BAA-974]